MSLTFAVTAITPAPVYSQNMATPDRDDQVTRGQLAGFDNFLDNNPQIAQDLRKDPSLINNRDYVEDHPDLKGYLQQHPEVREEFSQNPRAFMHDEQRYDRREDRGDRDNDVTRRELANMDHFLDSHPEIAEQLRRDPSLVDNQKFVSDHPALQQFLADHPGVREEFKENPNAFMRAEDRYDRREGQLRNPDITRGELAAMDQFLDRHPEIAEQLRKDPSLIDKPQFVSNHPQLQQFLADHPRVREEFKESPNTFMRDEERYDRRENSGMRRDHDVTRGELASFSEFMENHDKIADELSKNPSLANNEEYLENHAALKDYLQQHPQVHEELSENPQGFISSAQQFKTGATQKMATDSKLK